MVSRETGCRGWASVCVCVSVYGLPRVGQKWEWEGSREERHHNLGEEEEEKKKATKETRAMTSHARVHVRAQIQSPTCTHAHTGGGEF